MKYFWGAIFSSFGEMIEFKWVLAVSLSFTLLKMKIWDLFSLTTILRRKVSPRAATICLTILLYLTWMGAVFPLSFQEISSAFNCNWPVNLPTTTPLILIMACELNFSELCGTWTFPRVQQSNWRIKGTKRCWN